MAAEHDQRESPFETSSGLPVKRCYGSEDLEQVRPEQDIGQPGEFPYTRGIHPDMYRGKVWTKRVYVGFGKTENTNDRLRYLLSRGSTGLIIVPDAPAMMGIDADHPLAHGNVGVIGFPFSSLRDMEKIFHGIPLDQFSISMQWTSCATPAGFGAYLAMAEKRGVPWHCLKGSIYNDPIHAYFCCYQVSSPLELGPKLAVDIVEFCVKHIPQWHPLVLGGYEIREWGTSAAQEIAFAFSIAAEYVEAARRRGIEPDSWLPRLVFSTSVEMDLFEEAAKFRAARRLWAHLARERFGAKDPRSWRLKVSAKTSGSSLTAQQPVNNIARTTVEALAAILGGVQVVEPCGYDEAHTIPSEGAATVALNLLHILHHEARLNNTVDPLGGSYYVESLTCRLAEEAQRIMGDIDRLGGMVSALRKGWVQEQVRQEALRKQGQVESGERRVVGVNCYAVPPEQEVPIPIVKDKRLPELSLEQEAALTSLKRERDSLRWRRSLGELRRLAEAGEEVNLLPAIMDALKADATAGEIAGTIREAYGLSYDPLNVLSSPLKG